MAKLGISIKIDVTKIDKSRFFKGAKGTYLDLTTFIDTDQAGEYGDNGFITQSPTKEERANKMNMPILGNSTVFYNDSQGQNYQPASPSSMGQAPQPSNAPPANMPQGVQQAPQPNDDFEDDIPFSCPRSS